MREVREQRRMICSQLGAAWGAAHGSDWLCGQSCSERDRRPAPRRARPPRRRQDRPSPQELLVEVVGDHGSFRIHLSTLELLTAYVDFKRFVN
jgi:hypothetical protein